MRTLDRRAFLGAATSAMLATAAPRAFGEERRSLPRDLEVREIEVSGDRDLAQRFTLYTPKDLATGERVPLLVLLHGLGETGSERAGIFAWLDRYGLGTAYDRLRHPPIAPTTALRYWTPAHLAEVNASLTAKPFRGLAIACPYTPNFAKLPDPTNALDRYARWIAGVVVPRARREAPAFGDAAHTAIDGCSLGGYVGLEVFLRSAETFGAWGGVQSAFGAHRAQGFADRLAATVSRVGARALHIETSLGDPFHDANVALATALSARGVPRDLVILPGPHDQPWLREVGTLEMLLWHDRRPR